MAEQVRFHLDEHVPYAVAVALRGHGIDVTTTVEAGLRKADDLVHLRHAAGEGRVLVTHDADFLRHHTNIALSIMNRPGVHSGARPFA